MLEWLSRVSAASANSSLLQDELLDLLLSSRPALECLLVSEAVCCAVLCCVAIRSFFLLFAMRVHVHVQCSQQHLI